MRQDSEYLFNGDGEMYEDIIGSTNPMVYDTPHLMLKNQILRGQYFLNPFDDDEVLSDIMDDEEDHHDNSMEIYTT
jgi:hypothetical protein